MSSEHEDADYIVIPVSQKRAPNVSHHLLQKMVFEEWFWSCIEVGFRLDDYRYLPKFANEIPSEEDEMRLQNETDMTSFLSSPTAQFNSSTTSNKKRSKEQKEQDR